MSEVLAKQKETPTLAIAHEVLRNRLSTLKEIENKAESLRDKLYRDGPKPGQDTIKKDSDMTIVDLFLDVADELEQSMSNIEAYLSDSIKLIE